jgi:hypothetical protein
MESKSLHINIRNWLIAENTEFSSVKTGYSDIEELKTREVNYDRQQVAHRALIRVTLIRAHVALLRGVDTQNISRLLDRTITTLVRPMIR